MGLILKGRLKYYNFPCKPTPTTYTNPFNINKNIL